VWVSNLGSGAEAIFSQLRTQDDSMKICGAKLLCEFERIGYLKVCLLYQQDSWQPTRRMLL
jgi:hypothetical protein